MKNRTGAVAVALFCLAAAAHADSSVIGFDAGQSMNPLAALKAARTNEAAEAPRAIPADYGADDDPSAGKQGQAVEWVRIDGGKFMMGTDDGRTIFSNAQPIREVTIRDFEMSKTPVTVEQYEECVVKGGCTEPETDYGCNWRMAGRRRHPVNCVDWEQANQFARFKDARLPTEAEWEYAATSGGKNRKYPWGNETATCERAVMNGNGRPGCGLGGTMPVCSKPAGNAKSASGGELCDAVGNVWQWVQDRYKDSYANAPTDGGAVEDAGSLRVVRGGSFNGLPDVLRADVRVGIDPRYRLDITGFRLARSSR